jgi:hypothetical protein
MLVLTSMMSDTIVRTVLTPDRACSCGMDRLRYGQGLVLCSVLTGCGMDRGLFCLPVCISRIQSLLYLVSKRVPHQVITSSPMI